MSEAHESRPRADSSDIAFRKIFIGGLSYSTDEDKLRKYFQVYGSVQDAVVMKDPISKRSRGFGFITFYDIGSVDIVLAQEPHTIDQRKVEAKRAVPRSEISKENGTNSRPISASSTPVRGTTPTSSPQLTGLKPAASSASPTITPNYPDGKFATEPKYSLEDYAYNKIFVGGLHYDTRDLEFREYFEKYGRVVSAEVMFNRETHKSRGFGFIVFETEDSAIKVCLDREHIIDGKVVEVKRAIPRSKMFHNSSTLIDDSPTSIANIRSDVRRTMSAGNAQFLGAGGVLSSNSSTLAASAGVPKVPPMSGGYSTQRKPFSAAVSPPTKGGNGNGNGNTNSNGNGNGGGNSTGSGSSYASALKLGSAESSKDCNINVLLSPSVSSTSLSTLEQSPAVDKDNELTDLNALLRPNRNEFSVRTVRAQSEPIVRFDGNGLFGRDLLGLDVNSLGVTTTPQNSQNTSRSSSIYLSNNNLSSLFSPGGEMNFGSNLNATNAMSNMSWFSSSPQTNLSSFDDNSNHAGLLSLSLPPPAVSLSTTSEKRSDSIGVIGFAGNHSNTHPSSSIIGMSSSLVMEASNHLMKFPHSLDSDLPPASARRPSLSLFGESNTQDADMLSHGSRYGVVPSPEKWAAMFGVNNNTQNALGSSNSNFVPLASDPTWNGANGDVFHHHKNSFHESSSGASFFNDVTDSGGSRVLGFAGSQRSGTTTTESSEGFPGSTSTIPSRSSHPSIPIPADMDSFDVKSISQYSDLRLDSQEFVPQNSMQYWSSTIQ